MSSTDVKPKSNFARSKWKVLATAITKPKDFSDATSLVKFPSYQIIRSEPVKPVSDEDSHIWFNLSLSSGFPDINLKICQIPPNQFTLNDLTGFNNTGNLCIWPSEECLTQFCLDHLNLFDGKSVVELGGGMVSLSGLVVAACAIPKEVLLTDGNQASVDNLDKICDANPNLVNVSSCLLRWDKVPENLGGKFEIAISSDCLFFDEGRPQLLNCLKEVLCEDGEAVLVAPSRHGTFEKFVELVTIDQTFSVTVLENYSKKIDDIKIQLMSDPRFEDNLHYPKLIKLKKVKGLKISN